MFVAGYIAPHTGLPCEGKPRNTFAAADRDGRQALSLGAATYTVVERDNNGDDTAIITVRKSRRYTYTEYHFDGTSSRNKEY